MTTKPLRVLLISHTCQSRDEGQPKAVELGRFENIDLRVIVPNRWRHYGTWRGAEPKLDGCFEYRPTHVRLPWAGPAQWYLHYYPTLRQELESFRPDVIDVWEEPYGLASAHAIAMRNRHLPSARVVVETEQNINKRLPPPFEQFRRYSLRHADFAVGRNEEAVAILRAKGFAGPAEVVPNAVDIDRFAPLDRADCRASLGIGGGFAVGYVGRLVDEKGVDDIVAAMRELPADVRLVVAGDGPMRASLEALAGAPTFAGRVHLLGQVPAVDLPRVMNALDVLLLPSRTTARWKEQFGRVIIEAHACGVPVIGSTSGAIPWVIGEGGLVVPERDPAALAEAIGGLCAAPDEASRRGEAGRRRALSDFTWAAVASRMRAIYRRVAAAPRRSGGATR